MENLERRQLLSSTVGGSGTPNLNITGLNFPNLPFDSGTVVIVGGSALKGTVSIENIGDGIASGTTSLTVYLSDADNFVPSDPVLTTIPVNLKKLAPGKSMKIKVSVETPANVTGEKELGFLVNADHSFVESSYDDNVDEGEVFSLAAQNVNLGINAINAKVPKPGKSSSAKVQIQNNGNVAFNGSVPITLSLIDDNDDSTTVLTTTTAKVSVKPGQTKSVSVKFTLPTSFAGHAGSLSIQLDPSNTLHDSDLSDNTAETLI